MTFLSIKVLVICFCGSVLSQSKEDHSDDFYWREYTGEVPKDALPGGMDKEHNATYIGQVVEYGAIIPGQIFKGDNKVYYYGDYSARSSSENIKILCTQNPQNFEWVKTDGAGVKHIGTRRLVPGGYQYSDHIYIGRGIAGNMLSVGKIIIPSDASMPATFKTVVNGETYKPDVFEVLNYRLRGEYQQNSGRKIHFANTLAPLVLILLLL